MLTLNGIDLTNHYKELEMYRENSKVSVRLSFHPGFDMDKVLGDVVGKKVPLFTTNWSGLEVCADVYINECTGQADPGNSVSSLTGFTRFDDGKFT